jgi:hypothetical protein
VRVVEGPHDSAPEGICQHKGQKLNKPQKVWFFENRSTSGDFFWRIRDWFIAYFTVVDVLSVPDVTYEIFFISQIISSASR